MKYRARSLTDRIRDCGSLDTGSIPVGRTLRQAQCKHNDAIYSHWAGAENRHCV